MVGDPAIPLAESVRDLVAQHTGRRPRGPVRLLTHLRYFGHGFNPVRFYYCFDADGASVEHIVAEVSNTPWGEQHCYVLSTAPAQHRQRVQCFELDKQFHVSPFMSMDIHYRWSFTRPGEQLFVHLQNRQHGHRLFDATLFLDRKPLDSAQLPVALLRYPFMTLRVVAAIYWQALRLWLKKSRSIRIPARKGHRTR